MHKRTRQFNNIFTSRRNFTAIGLLLGSIALSNQAVALDDSKYSFSAVATNLSENGAINGDYNTQTYGLEYSYSNKSYKTSGLVYKANGYLDFGYYDGTGVDRYGIKGEIGQRYALDHDLFVDLIGGVGYESFNFDISTEDGENTRSIEIPYVRLGVGAGKFISDTRMIMVETGVDYNIGATSDYIDNKDDLDNNSNFYFEASMVNVDYHVPFNVGIFYKNYDLSGDSSSFKTSQIGLKVGTSL